MTQTEKQNVPKLRFPGFEEEWENKTLGDFFTFKNGVNADKSAYGRGRKFINVLDIISDRPITSDSIIGSVDISDKEFAKNEVRYGDILFQRSSETREEVGQSNIYCDREQSATFGGFVIRGRPIVDIESEFFHKLLKTAHVRKDMTARSGGSTRYNVGQESLSLVPINIAPTDTEQRKIASFLGSVDEKIDQLSRKKALLEDYKKGCMQQIFSQEIRFKEDQGNDFPDWEEKRLGEVLKVGSGRDYKHLNKGDIPVYGTGGLMTYVDDFIYDGESVCIGRKGTIDKPTLIEGKFWTVDTLFYTHSFKNSLPKFIYAVFQGINWQIHNEASGVPSLSKSTIEKLKINLPHPDEQRKIADFLSALDTKIDLVAQELEHARTFKKGLLQQMFV